MNDATVVAGVVAHRWMLRTGVALDEACERVHALVGVTDAANTAHGTSSWEHLGRRSARTGGCHRGATSAKAAPDQLGDTPVWPEIADADRDRFAEAVRLNRQHWVDAGRPISAATLRLRLRVSADTSREFTRAVRTGDRAAVIAGGVLYQ